MQDKEKLDIIDVGKLGPFFVYCHACKRDYNLALGHFCSDPDDETLPEKIEQEV